MLGFLELAMIFFLHASSQLLSQRETNKYPSNTGHPSFGNMSLDQGKTLNYRVSQWTELCTGIISPHQSHSPLTSFQLSEASFNFNDCLSTLSVCVYVCACGVYTLFCLSILSYIIKTRFWWLQAKGLSSEAPVKRICMSVANNKEELKLMGII